MMGKKLIINKLKKSTILKPSFETLKSNNCIEFSNQGIAVVYAPNGTGKTTISKIMKGEENTEIEVEFEGQSYGNANRNSLFHVISDQISRNIIAGNTDEFILGEDIAKERQTKASLDKEFQVIIDSLKEILKTEFKITKQSTPFIDAISEEKFKDIVSIIGKKGSKITDIDIEKFLELFTNQRLTAVCDHDADKLIFYLEDVSDKAMTSKINQIKGINMQGIEKSETIRVVERNSTAISVLQKYCSIPYCVVCDTQDIDPVALLNKKHESTKAVYASLSAENKKMLDKIVNGIAEEDPFRIKEIVLKAVETGNSDEIVQLLEVFKEYQSVAEALLKNRILGVVSTSQIAAIYALYKAMITDKLVLHEDDEILIKDIISDSLGIEVTLERDEEKNIIIKLGSKQLIGTNRDDFQLSTGEQNFLSLAFELLKAKNVVTPIIVMDDPISSFDSIYKNKIAYCIVKILEKKQQIIFTHNIDLVRLLDVQRTHCFNMYLLGNDNDDECGFLQVESSERAILLYLDKLLDHLRSPELDLEIQDERLYIISLIPFMRSIVKVVNPPERKEYTDKLTSLMHGYGNEVVDVTPIYNKLFGKAVTTSYLASACDIISLDITALNFIKKDNYPLLAKTLEHTLTYLYLRLNVEKVLRDKFPQQTRKCELLGDFIYKALSDTKYQSERVKLTSKKTLLNEFNHYEGNFNIFQPAIDITESSLYKEKVEIINILDSIISKS
jgi:energy-coupling factor transporter ATP-binding protein EcfA2